MELRKTNPTDVKLAVDINTLADMCCLGTASAKKLGDDAGASIQIGRRRLYNVQKVQKYLDCLSGV